MNEDPRLREGIQARASPSGSVAADTANGVYAALYLGTNTTSPVLFQYPAAVGMSMNPGAQFLLLLFLEALKARICHEPK